MLCDLQALNKKIDICNNITFIIQNIKTYMKRRKYIHKTNNDKYINVLGYT